jgi:hypothetical protein
LAAYRFSTRNAASGKLRLCRAIRFMQNKMLKIAVAKSLFAIFHGPGKKSSAPKNPPSEPRRPTPRQDRLNLSRPLRRIPTAPIRLASSIRSANSCLARRSAPAKPR